MILHGIGQGRMKPGGTAFTADEFVMIGVVGYFDLRLEMFCLENRYVDWNQESETGRRGRGCIYRRVLNMHRYSFFHFTRNDFHYLRGNQSPDVNMHQ